MVLLLTGTCGSGKSTIAGLLEMHHGWTQVAEDPIWKSLFGRDRGQFGTAEHRAKRAAVHTEVFAQIRAAIAFGADTVVEATVHQSPPEAYHEYREFFQALSVPSLIRVLHPRLAVAVARDAARTGWHAGPDRVASLHAKFGGTTFPSEWFLDTSDETAEETAARLNRLRVG